MKILKKILIGLFLFYVITGFVIIPLALMWGIKSQGSKMLNTPVNVRSVFFNPFLLQLNIKGFDLADKTQQTMAAFDRLSVDVSFLGFFKKRIHIESVELEGLHVNGVLLPGGKVNLAEVVPQQTATGQAAPATPPQPKAGTKEAKSTSQPLPDILIDRIQVRQGQIRFTDQTVQPPFTTALNNIELDIAHVSTDPKEPARIDLRMQLDDKGTISAHADLKPLAQPPELESTFTLKGYVMPVLTPYVGKYTGRALRDGRLDLHMDYRVSANKLSAGHSLTIQKFEFGDKVESKDALSLPFGLAVGLLEDPQGRIRINLPVTGDMNDPKFEYMHLLTGVIKNFFIKLLTKPFSVLGSMLGMGADASVEEMGYVRFEPGKSELTDRAKEKLKKLIDGLKERPKLSLDVPGSYDPDIDWKAIQADVFARDYELLQKDSTKPEGKVYQMLYQRRFGLKALWALAKKHKKSTGKYDDAVLNEEIKRQLIESAPPDEAALGELGRARAKNVYEYLIANGFDAARLKMSKSHAAQGSMGFVPLEFILTVPQ